MQLKLKRMELGEEVKILKFSETSLDVSKSAGMESRFFIKPCWLSWFSMNDNQLLFFLTGLDILLFLNKSIKRIEFFGLITGTPEKSEHFKKSYAYY